MLNTTIMDNKTNKEAILEKILKLKLSNPFCNKLEIQRLQQLTDYKEEDTQQWHNPLRKE